MGKLAATGAHRLHGELAGARRCGRLVPALPLVSGAVRLETPEGRHCREGAGIAMQDQGSAG